MPSFFILVGYPQLGYLSNENHKVLMLDIDTGKIMHWHFMVYYLLTYQAHYFVGNVSKFPLLRYHTYIDILTGLPDMQICVNS